MSLFTVLLIVLSAVVYSWALYNLPVLIVGIRSFRREGAKKQSFGRKAVFEKNLPTFSVVIPAKNEESVLPRLLGALLKQNYPRKKVEVIVVEDGSTDATLEVCEKYVKDFCGRLKIVCGGDSTGKPSALNRALRISRGDIIAVFDADNVPEQDALLNAAKHFQDETIAALQGRTFTLNSGVNMLTKFVSYEEAVYFEVYLKGRDVLNLFVHLKGSCEFIRRSVLESLGGWSEENLSEDMEMSARLTQKGHRIRYAADVQSWQESTETLAQMFRQRIRWFRGCMEVAFKYGRLMERPGFRVFDAEVTLLGPFVLIISLLSYILGPLVFYQLDSSVVFAITLVGWGLLTGSIVAGALALLYTTRPRRIRDLLWLPFIYAYWSFQVFLATWALIKILCRAPKEWNRTPKTGVIAVASSTLPDCLVISSCAERRRSLEAAGKPLG